MRRKTFPCEFTPSSASSRTCSASSGVECTNVPLQTKLITVLDLLGVSMFLSDHLECVNGTERRATCRKTAAFIASGAVRTHHPQETRLIRSQWKECMILSNYWLCVCVWGVFERELLITRYSEKASGVWVCK